MKATLLFTQEDAWAGGFYELVIELPGASKDTIRTALQQLWCYPSLEGCFLQPDIEPSGQQKVSPMNVDHEDHWYGIASLPNGNETCCGSFWGNYHESGCWMTFYLPIGSLGRAYPVEAYPFKTKTELSPEPWLKEVGLWFLKIATSVYQEVKFKVALIGYEIDFFDISEKLKKGVPTKRWDGILIPYENELKWYPPTIYEPPYVLEKRLLQSNKISPAYVRRGKSVTRMHGLPRLDLAIHIYTWDDEDANKIVHY